MKAIKITQDNLQSEILEQPFAILMFTSMGDVVGVDTIFFLETTEHKVGCVDFDLERELVHKFSIRVLPTVLIFKNGRIFRSVNTIESTSELSQLLEG